MTKSGRNPALFLLELGGGSTYGTMKSKENWIITQVKMIISTPFLSNALKLWMGCITISLLRLKV